MAFEYLSLENPEVLAVAVGVILFVISFYVLSRSISRRGHAFVIGFVISALAAWQLYREHFYGLEGMLIIAIYFAVVAVFVRILWAFVKHLTGHQ